MQATGWVAIYAAAVSTASLGWQVWNARRARRPHVEVALSHTVYIPPTGSAESTVQIDVRNRGDIPVQVASVGVRTKGRATMLAAPRRGESTLPGEIHPRDAGFTYFPTDELSSLDLSRPLVGWALLSTGEHIDSKPMKLLARALPNSLRAAEDP